MTLAELIQQATAIQNQVSSAWIPIRINDIPTEFCLELHTEIPGYVYVDIKEKAK